MKYEPVCQSSSALAYELALWRMPGLGPKKHSEFLRKYPDLQALFQNPVKLLESVDKKPQDLQYFKNPDWSGVEKDFAWLTKQPRRYILNLKDACYPYCLAEIKHAPPILFFEGSLDSLNRSQLAIVGSRKPSPQGEAWAFKFAQELAGHGFVITSGLALGIDAAAHKGALAAECREQKKTIGVLACGLDVLYPRQNQALAEALLAHEGGLVSEFPVGVRPRPEYFPRRNRIISGLSWGVLVVEAMLKSGSLITAQYAVEQGREVFALPGPIQSALHKGCHALLKQGAKLVENLEDIVQELTHGLPSIRVPIGRVSKLNQQTLEGDVELQSFLRYIDYENTAVDLIVARSGLDLPSVLYQLFELELQGLVTAGPSGYMKVLV